MGADGHRYDSMFEARVADELGLRKKAKDIKDYQRQVRLDLRVNGQHVCFYKIDFIIIHNDGHKEFLEVKGLELPLWRIKWRLLEILHEEMEPGSELTVVKQSSRW